MKTFKLDQKTKIKAGFTVPENYFFGLSENVMQRVEQPETKVLPLYQNGKLWLYVAAAVLVLALTIPAIDGFSENLVAPDANAIENYFAYHAELSEDELVNLLESEDIEDIKIDYQLEEKALEDMLSTNADIENYLND